MGLWGAAQSIAFAGGGFVGTVLADAARALIGTSSVAYALVFAFEAVAFVAATAIALRIVFEQRVSEPRVSEPRGDAGPLQPAPLRAAPVAVQASTL